MSRMRRLTACVLTACLSFSLVSCGSLGKPALEKIEEISGELGIDDPVQEVMQAGRRTIPGRRPPGHLPGQRRSPRLLMLRVPGQKRRNRKRFL